MPRKLSKGKKPKETMRQRQLRLIRERKAAKAAAAKAPKPKKALPPKGGTSAGSAKARYQRARTAGRQAEGQVRTFANALRKTMKQRAASDKLERAAKGSKGTTVRTAGGKTPKRLPAAGQTGKYRSGGRPSARQAIARGKQVRAAQGTKGTKVRTGQPAGSENRMYGANRVNQAVRRAQRSTAVGKLKSGLKSGLKQGALSLGADFATKGINKALGTKRNEAYPIVSTMANLVTAPLQNYSKLSKKKKSATTSKTRTGGGQGNRGARRGGTVSGNRPTPKATPKVTTKPATPKKSSAPKASRPASRPSAPARKPQSKDMAANYRAWAKANPALAKKVKKGQAGYKALNPDTRRKRGGDGIG